MKIKHFAGYGSVTAKRTFSKVNTQTRICTHIVEVMGNHEYGLNRSSYPDDCCRWLAKVIKDDYITNNPYDVKVTFTHLPSIDGVDRAQYTFTYAF